MEQFQSALATMKSIRFVSTFEELDDFLAHTDVLRARAAQVLTGRRKAIAEITAALGDRTILEALADADGTFGDTIRNAGFMFDQDSVAPVVVSQAKRLLDVLRLEESMEERATRQLIAQQANVLPADVNTMMMWKYLDSKRFAGRYLEKMAESGLNTEGLTPERLVDLAGRRRETESLVRAELLTMDAGKGFLGLGERLAWLLFVSMLVCGIGICNAMLMTVTERFTEIATLKCLGALDGFIMIMFVLESCFLGVVGGTFGAIIGALIGTGRMLVAFGTTFVSAMPVVDILLGILVAILIGVFLAAVAAVLPSFKAARLAPMEAMRIE
jgi:putative ABC transport system permease protein